MIERAMLKKTLFGAAAGLIGVIGIPPPADANGVRQRCGRGVMTGSRESRPLTPVHVFASPR
jgi:hypothetical protein